MTYRLARFHVNPLVVWVVPALAGLAVTAYLCWGAWVTAHDPGGSRSAMSGGGWIWRLAMT